MIYVTHLHTIIRFQLPSRTVLLGSIDLTLETKLLMSVYHCGFVNQSSGMSYWNLRWCILDNRKLMFWNYPKDQDCKPPICELDLVNCVSEKISLVDNTMCPRARTLLIETCHKLINIDRRDSAITDYRENYSFDR